MTECSSSDGITIGLIDAIITLADVLNERLETEGIQHKATELDWFSSEVTEALADLSANASLRKLLFPRDDAAMQLIIDAAKYLKETPAEKIT